MREKTKTEWKKTLEKKWNKKLSTYYSIWKTNLPRWETTTNYEISNLAHYTSKQENLKEAI